MSDTLSIPTLLYSSTLALLTYFLYHIIQTFYVSSLSHIPGPALAALTHYYLLIIDLAGHRTSTIHKWHTLYGPTIRIGPNELSFSSAEANNDIYVSGKNFTKASTYDQFAFPPRGVLLMTDREEHRRRRRILAPPFAPSELPKMEAVVESHLKRLLSRICERNGQSMDMLKAFRMLSLDVVSHLFLGESFHGLEKVDEKGELVVPGFLHDMEGFFLVAGLEYHFTWFLKGLKLLPWKKWQHFLGSGKRCMQVGLDAVASRLSVNEAGGSAKKKDLLDGMLEVMTKSKSPEESITQREIGCEMSNMLLAGTDTTSISLTYLFWELAQRPMWQEKLRNELASAKTKLDVGNEELTFRQLDDLPILDAVMLEGLRLHPAAPASLQRVSVGGEKVVDGIVVPEDTIVSAQCYTTHRNAHVFPDPGSFLPERWLDPVGGSSAMKSLWSPFSKGPRGCLGKGLGMMELKMTMAAILPKYQVKLATEDGMKTDDMDMIDHFLMQPKGGRCLLAFEQCRIWRSSDMKVL